MSFLTNENVLLQNSLCFVAIAGPSFKTEMRIALQLIIIPHSNV